MEKLNFKDALHFDEFPPVSTGEWEAIIQSDLKGKDYKEILRWISGEGIEPLPFYRREDLKELAHEPDPVHTKADWRIVELIQYPDLKSANEHALHALANGATGLRFELPSSSVTGLKELRILLKDIQLDLISVQFGHELSNLDVAEMLREIVQENGLKPEDVHISFYSDLFSSALRTGKLPELSGLKDHLKAYPDIIRICASDNALYGNSGATVVQQLAFALASGNEYLGLMADASPRGFFNFISGPNYFLEIAKFRAFTILWEQVLAEYNVSTHAPYITAETPLWNKSKTDAHNNMLRSTTEAMSAALGGCDAITVHRYDEHFAENSSFSSRIARNIQLILQEESYLNKVADPGAGSYYIEVLTDSLAKESWKLFQKIEQKGGFHECLRSGFIQEMIATSRQEKITAYQEKKKVLVGVNKYQPDEDPDKINSVARTFEYTIADQDNMTSIDSISPLSLEDELQHGDRS